MDKEQKIRSILEQNHLLSLKRFNKIDVLKALLSILEKDLDTIDFEDDITYLNNIIKIIPNYAKKNKKYTHDMLVKIHQKIKIKLVQKPGNINKKSRVYKDLKKMINNIEILQVSMLYDFEEKYNQNKYELLEYIIYDLKNASFLDFAFKKFPHLANYKDKNDVHIFLNIVNKYIEEVTKFNDKIGIDTILYYDEIIDIFLKSDKFILDVIDKQIILKKIKENLVKIRTHKHRKSFYLNNLFLKIENKEQKPTLEHIEYKYNINKEFDEAVKTELNIRVDSFDSSKDRTVIDDRVILSFDNENTEEIDDALSVELLDNDNVLLGVHIASPLSIIKEDDVIFDEASDRTTSIYLPDQIYPMLPKELSKNLISLREGNYRNAITYFFEIDPNGNLVNQKYVKSLINVTKNMTYREFDERLKYNDTDIDKTIKLLSYASNNLQKYYNEDPIYSAINRKNNNITNTNIIQLSSGGKVVENSMVFTNLMLSKYFKDNQLPFIYRNHIIDSESKQKLDGMKNNFKDADYAKYIDIINNIYPKSFYDIECKGHQGIGVDTYCHITSPIRRFADLIATLCLDKFYFHEYDEKTIEDTKQLILKQTNKINKKRNSIEKFTKEYENLTR